MTNLKSKSFNLFLLFTFLVLLWILNLNDAELSDGETETIQYLNMMVKVERWSDESQKAKRNFFFPVSPQSQGPEEDDTLSLDR